MYRDVEGIICMYLGLMQCMHVYMYVYVSHPKYVYAYVCIPVVHLQMPLRRCAASYFHMDT